MRDTLDQMSGLSLVEDAADEDAIPEIDKDRLDRQLRYFSDVVAQGGPSPAECQERLREASVAVLGAGGLGGRTAYAACFEAGIPYITMNQMPSLVRIGPLYVPGQTGCFECQAMRYRRDYPLLDVVIEQRRGVEPQAVTLGPASGTIGGLIGMEVLHFLTGVIEPASLGVGLTLDFRTMTFEREPLIRESDCPVCGAL